MTSPYGSLASDLFGPEIWGDLVKISRWGTENRERTINHFFLILNSDEYYIRVIGQTTIQSATDQWRPLDDGRAKWRPDFQPNI